MGGCSRIRGSVQYVAQEVQMMKRVLVALPSGLMEQADYVAQAEHRNRSDLIREAIRRYIESFKREQRPLRHFEVERERELTAI